MMMGKVAKVGALLCFKEGVPETQRHRTFLVGFYRPELLTQSQLNNRVWESSLTSNEYMYSGKTQMFYSGRKKGLWVLEDISEPLLQNNTYHHRGIQRNKLVKQKQSKKQGLNSFSNLPYWSLFSISSNRSPLNICKYQISLSLRQARYKAQQLTRAIRRAFSKPSENNILKDTIET